MPKLFIVLVQNLLAYSQTFLTHDMRPLRPPVPTPLGLILPPTETGTSGMSIQAVFPFPTGLFWVCSLSALSALQTCSSNRQSSALDAEVGRFARE